MNAYPSKVFIDVWNCRARVAKYIETDGGTTWVYAANADELADDAAQAVEDAGGWLTASGHYPCPHALTIRAVWPIEQQGDNDA